MIIYFTGTGNSRYAAEYISDKIHDAVLDLFEKIRAKDYSEIHSDSPYVLCCPTYCWQIPHIVRDWLEKTTLSGSDDLYFVMTCGSEIGNAEKYLKSLCRKIGKNYMGCAEIVMPENYIALFEAPDPETAQDILADSEIQLAEVAETIAAHKKLEDVKTNLLGKLYSSVINDVFYPIVVKDKKFIVSDECIGCGLCEKKCVLNNITLENGRPVWKGTCTHCMACICYCPKQAIEYGKNSRGKVRYTCREYR